MAAASRAGGGAGVTNVDEPRYAGTTSLRRARIRLRDSLQQHCESLIERGEWQSPADCKF